MCHQQNQLNQMDASLCLWLLRYSQIDVDFINGDMFIAHVRRSIELYYMLIYRF